MVTDLLIFLFVSFVINILMFLVAFALRTDKLTDISYAASFISLAIFGLLLYGATPVGLLVAAMVMAWAARLGTFLLMRIRKTGKDPRFDAIRGDFIKFGKFWVAQGVSVWAILLAAELLWRSQGNSFTLLSAIGGVIWLAGLLIEATADFQKFHFTSSPANKGKWIDQGIWHYSRHPNYLGEIMVWIGLYLVILPNLSLTEAFISLASPMLIVLLLLFVSGIPPLEKMADKRWGADTNYQAYKRRTSLLLLWPPKQG